MTEEVRGELWWAEGCQLSGHEAAASIRETHTRNPSHMHLKTYSNSATMQK